MLFHLFHLVSICAAHRGLWHALQLLSLGDDCLHVILLFVNLVHHLQVLLNDVLCGRDRTCSRNMTTDQYYNPDNLVPVGGIDEKPGQVG